MLLLVIGSVVFLAGLITIVSGNRLVVLRRSSSARCPFCAYRLRGLDLTKDIRCPECGAALPAKAWGQTVNLRRPRLVAFGVALCLIGAGTASVPIGRTVKDRTGFEWIHLVPTGMLLDDTAPGTNTYTELLRRAANGSLSDAHVQRITGLMEADDRSELEWLELQYMLWVGGSIGDGRLRRWLEGLDWPSPCALRQRIRQGCRIPWIRPDSRSVNFSTCYVWPRIGEIEFDGRPIDRSVPSSDYAIDPATAGMSAVTTRRRGGGLSESYPASAEDLPTVGRHSLKFSWRYEIKPRSSPTKPFHFELQQEFPVDVLPPDEPAVLLADSPDAVKPLSEWLRAALVTRDAKWFKVRNEEPFTPPFDFAFDLLVRDGPREWCIDRILSRGDRGVSLFSIFKIDPRIDVSESVDLVLRPRAKMAELGRRSSPSLASEIVGREIAVTVPVRFEDGTRPRRVEICSALPPQSDVALEALKPIRIGSASRFAIAGDGVVWMEEGGGPVRFDGMAAEVPTDLRLNVYDVVGGRGVALFARPERQRERWAAPVFAVARGEEVVPGDSWAALVAAHPELFAAEPRPAMASRRDARRLQMIVDAAGRRWIAWRNLLTVVDKGRPFDSFQITGGLWLVSDSEGRRIYAVDHNGQIHVARLDGTSFVLDAVDVPDARRVWACVRDAAGVLWFAAWPTGGWKAPSVPLAIRVAPDGSVESIRGVTPLFVDGSGTLFLGCEQADGTVLVEIRGRDGAVSMLRVPGINWSSRFIEVATGSILITTKHGIQHIRIARTDDLTSYELGLCYWPAGFALAWNVTVVQLRDWAVSPLGFLVIGTEYKVNVTGRRHEIGFFELPDAVHAETDPTPPRQHE